MYFKPKIFISSTFSLMELRSDIKGFFETVGAETILYEKDLTPSITPLAYRQDIKDADFIIFIFNEKYGSKTDTGKSGTHEEWDIIRDTNIPKHVYLKKSGDFDPEQEEFIQNNIKNISISYYYYSDHTDMLNQIKKMTFTISRDIAIHKLFELKIEDKAIKKLAFNRDYSLALNFIQEIDLLRNLQFKGFVDLVGTTILIERISGWFEYFFNSSFNIFIDNKMNELFSNLYESFNDFIEIQQNSTQPNGRNKIVFWPEKNFKYFPTSLRIICDKNQEIKMHNLLESFLKKCVKFEKYVFNEKADFEKSDCNYWII